MSEELNKATEIGGVEFVLGTLPYPDGMCVGPTEARNYNPFPVMVTYIMNYEGLGPEHLCQAQWTTEEKLRLERFGLPGSSRFVGCSLYHHHGSPCSEQRSWTVKLIERAASGVMDG